MSLVFFWTYATNFNLEVSSWASVFFFFFLFFLILVMPKGLRANLNVADISSVLPYPEYLQGRFQWKWEFFPLGWHSQDLQPWRAKKLGALWIFLVLFEAGSPKLKIWPFVLRMHIRSPLCPLGKIWQSWWKKQDCLCPHLYPLPQVPVPSAHWRVGPRSEELVWGGLICSDSPPKALQGCTNACAGASLERSQNNDLAGNDGWPLSKYMPWSLLLTELFLFPSCNSLCFILI